MPSVDAAMLASHRDGLLQHVKNALVRRSATGLSQRDILVDAADRVYSVKKAFSSWDNCMKATFCKWPVIAVIIVGSLILISIIWCIVRCTCCGLSCCCSCCRCLKCCGNCCGCCDAPGRRNNKYLDEPYVPPNHGYQAHAPMQPPFASPSAPLKQQVFEPPQYAEFDLHKKGGDDALPQMPSWEGGSSIKVLLENNEVELDELNKPPLVSNSALATPPPGLNNKLGSSGDYMAPHAISPGRHSPDYHHDAYGAYAANSSQGYDTLSSAGHGYGAHQPYGVAQQPYGNADAMGSHAHDAYAQRYGPYSHSPTEMPSDGLYSSSHDNAYQAAHTGYQMRDTSAHDMRFESPRAAPTPHGQPRYNDAGYGSSHSYANQPYSSATPARGPEAAWQHNFAQSPPDSPITNNAGFDFTSGYARPPTQDAGPNDSQWPPPAQAYPGYKPYQRY